MDRREAEQSAAATITPRPDRHYPAGRVIISELGQQRGGSLSSPLCREKGNDDKENLLEIGGKKKKKEKGIAPTGNERKGNATGRREWCLRFLGTYRRV